MLGGIYRVILESFRKSYAAGILLFRYDGFAGRFLFFGLLCPVGHDLAVTADYNVHFLKIIVEILEGSQKPFSNGGPASYKELDMRLVGYDVVLYDISLS